MIKLAFELFLEDDRINTVIIFNGIKMKWHGNIKPKLIYVSHDREMLRLYAVNYTIILN